jgi:3-hexulose-6-phosphate synthase
MKLQLALDEFDLHGACEIVDEVKDQIDIIEVGTPFVIRSGVGAVRELARRYPDKEILADTKIMDGGYFETKLALDAGASYVTVLGVTDDSTIRGCLKATRETGRALVVDMVCVEDLAARTRECEELGADVLAVHTGVDQQACGRTPLEDLRIMKSAAKRARIAVAGGINSSTIESYVELKPDIVIVGGAIAHADDAHEEARLIKQAMSKAE